MYNLWIVEAAINTYVKPDGCHKLFESETDLVYLPDLKRYLIFLTHEVRSGIEYLEVLSCELGNKIEMLGDTQQDLEHWLGAGKKTLSILENSHKKASQRDQKTAASVWFFGLFWRH
jgi:hypothetical protein